MKLVKYLFVLGSSIFVACGSPQQPIASPTPQEEIINNIALTSFPDRTFMINVPQDTSCARTLLQAAIDSCSVAGGGTVKVSEGHYFLNGPLHLKSDVNLNLAEGAYLQFSGKSSDFLPVVLTRWEGTELYGHSPKREFDIKSKDSKLPVIDKVYINGGFLLKKAVCCNSRQRVGYKVIE